MPPLPLLPATSKRLSRGVSFGDTMSYSNKCIPTTYDAGHRHQVCFDGLGAFGQNGTTPSLPPGVPKPPIPGYVTEEQCQATAEAAVQAVNEGMTKKHIMLGVGGLVIGWGIGFVVGKSGKRY